jgi:uncharacterized protein DUF4197
MRLYIVMVALMMFTDAQAGWQDILGDVVEKTTKSETPSADSIQSDALRAALKQGVGYAVSTLGKKDGYLNDAKAKISLPENLSTMETLVRKNGGDEMLDDLVLSMNNAATQAAPQTVDIFFAAIQKMTIADAQKILKSSDNALSEYFKKSSYGELESMIKPIVTKMMDENKVSYYYKQVRNTYEENSEAIPYKDSVLSVGKSFGLDAYVPPKELDTYVTEKAIGGLFIKIAEEEKSIRDNPMVQKSQLIRDVFGSI